MENKTYSLIALDGQQYVRENPELTEPHSEYYRLLEDYKYNYMDYYESHLSTLSKYIAIGLDHLAGRGDLVEGKDFKLQHQILNIDKATQAAIWQDYLESEYNLTNPLYRRIVAIQPDPINKEIQRLKELLREVCVRANIIFPETEQQLDQYEKMFVDQHELMLNIGATLGLGELSEEDKQKNETELKIIQKKFNSASTI